MKLKIVIICIGIILCLTSCSLHTDFIEEINKQGTESVMDQQKVKYIQSIIRINDNYYIPAGKSSIHLPEGYEKSGEVTCSDKEELPQENFVMIPKEEEGRFVYQNKSDDQYIYMEVPYLYVSDKEKTIFPHYVCYSKENAPEISVEPLEGFPVYVCMDGKIFYPGSYSQDSLGEKGIDGLKKLGMIEYCDENDIVKQDGYGGQERYLGAVVYREESTGNYYMNMADHDLWLELIEGTEE